MCMVSLITDDFRKTWEPKPWYPEPVVHAPPYSSFVSNISRAEFDALKQEMEMLKKLLEYAKKYDALTAQPDCEKPELIAILKRIASAVGVDISDVLKPNNSA